MRVGSVQLLQSRSDVAESCASIAFEIESGRQTGSVVADGDVEALSERDALMSSRERPDLRANP